MALVARAMATVADLLALPAEQRFHELLGGELVEKSTPSAEHGYAQSGAVTALQPSFQRRTGHGGPGGWWFATEVEVALSTGDVVRPDVMGWRRDRHPARPTGTPVTARPDWVCEVLSPHGASRDTVKKLRLYALAGIPHYWLLDPDEGTLTVLRCTDGTYQVALTAERGETVRAEPFDAIAVAVAALFGDDPE